MEMGIGLIKQLFFKVESFFYLILDFLFFKIGFLTLVFLFLTFKFGIVVLIPFFLCFFLQYYFNLQFLCGLIGEFAIRDALLLKLTILILISIIFSYFFSFFKALTRKAFDQSPSRFSLQDKSDFTDFTKVDRTDIHGFFHCLSLQVHLTDEGENNFFKFFAYEVEENRYPVNWIIYDVHSYFKNNKVFVLVSNNKKKPHYTRITLIFFKGRVFRTAYYESLQHLERVKNIVGKILNYLGILKKDNYFFFGIDYKNKLVKVNLSNIYHFFFILGLEKISWTYLQTHIFSKLFENKNNIIVKSFANPNEEKSIMYKTLINTLEKVYLQAKVQKKKTFILFLKDYFTFLGDLQEDVNFSAQINQIMQWLDLSIGVFRIFMIEQDSGNLKKIIGDYESFDANPHKAIFMNKANSMEDSVDLTGFYGVERNQFDFLFYCQWNNNITYSMLPYSDKKTDN